MSLTPNSKIPLVNLDVIGSRPQPIVPDGVFIEVQGQKCENEAVHDAAKEEELILTTTRNKNEKLKQFQLDVKRRVSQAVQIHKKFISDAQAIKMELEREVLYRSATAAEASGLKKNRCTYNVNDITIDQAGKLTSRKPPPQITEKEADPLLEIRSQQAELTTATVRQRLAERSIVAEQNENNQVNLAKNFLPGGIWGVGVTREKCPGRFNLSSEYCKSTEKCANDEKCNVLETVAAKPAGDDVLLASLQESIASGLQSCQKRMKELGETYLVEKENHDPEDEVSETAEDPVHPIRSNVHFSLPDEISESHSAPSPDSTVNCPILHDLKEPSFTTSSNKPIHDSRCNKDIVTKYRRDIGTCWVDVGVPPIMYPGAVAYGQKLADEKSRWLSRRVFADAERERSREHAKMREHKERVARLRAESEKLRSEVENKSREHVEAVTLANETMRREIQRQERRALKRKELEAKKRKRTDRFVLALLNQLRNRLNQNKIELPPLCLCGTTFWDTNPDTCANNCVFYRNPEAYSKALEAVLQVIDRNTEPFHKDALQRCSMSLPLVQQEKEDNSPESARSTSRSFQSCCLSLGSL